MDEEDIKSLTEERDKYHRKSVDLSLDKQRLIDRVVELELECRRLKFERDDYRSKWHEWGDALIKLKSKYNEECCTSDDLMESLIEMTKIVKIVDESDIWIFHNTYDLNKCILRADKLLESGVSE